MKTEKLHLNFYLNRMKNGELLPVNGLCNCALSGYIDHELFKMLTPKNASPFIFWAATNPFLSNSQRMFGFNPLRQNIVLFMAAMNGEL